MVAAGLGITLLHKSAVPDTQTDDNSLVRYVHLDNPAPYREVALVYRRSFTSQPAIDALVKAVKECGMAGVEIV